MGIPHFLAIPYPILGHMNPVLQFCQVLAKHGCQITFLSSDESFNRLKAASEGKLMESQMRLVSLTDGVGPEDDRYDLPMVIESTRTTMCAKLPKLIEDVNAIDSDNKITCIIVTKNMGWALEVGHNLGIKGALFWPTSATALAFVHSIPMLIVEEIIHPENGLPIKEIQLSSNLPKMKAAAMPWYDLDTTSFFLHMKQEIQTLNQAEWWLCNTTSDLEADAFSILPKLLPIGTLMASDHSTSSFWQEDKTCLDWLDQQPPHSVIYVSFGSMVSTKPNQFKELDVQFNELALGLDFLKKPFLWVLRTSNADLNKCFLWIVRTSNGKNVNNAYPNEFHGNQGKIIGWAPQNKILSHPAIACFISHCD